MDDSILQKCILFAGLSPEETAYALDFFSASEKKYQKGEILNVISAPLARFGLVLAGTIQVYMHDLDGNNMILANVEAGGTFGESLCFLRRDAPISICSVTDSAVLWMNTDRIRHPAADFGERELLLANRFTAMLADRTLSMNDRIQILCRASIREKLMTFFSQYISRTGKTAFTIPFDRDNMAAYLGVNRSALSRELSKMQAEGILSFRKNHFTIQRDLCDF